MKTLIATIAISLAAAGASFAGNVDRSALPERAQESAFDYTSNEMRVEGTYDIAPNVDMTTTSSIAADTNAVSDIPNVDERTLPDLTQGR